jgi:shikimate kinase
MKMPGNIFLVGPMGAGKSTVGRYLATSLNKDFWDSDHVIEERTGVGIPVIFDLEGELGFRTREQKIIQELSEKTNIVLATGGGVILCPENRKYLRANGCVVYLRCPVDRQLERTMHDKNRPLLQTANPREKLQLLFDQRDPLYEKTADIIIDTGKYSVKYIAGLVTKMIEERS